MSDQDKAQVNAIKTVFPNSSLQLCKFHILKNFKRKIFTKDNRDFYKKSISLFKAFYWSRNEFEVIQNIKTLKDYLKTDSRFKNLESDNYFADLLINNKTS